MTTEIMMTNKQFMALREKHQGLPVNISVLIRDVEQAVLQSPEIQAMRKDAERYRFIRDASCDENEPLLNKAGSEIRSRIPKDRIAPRYEDYDAGIDSAMEQQK